MSRTIACCSSRKTACLQFLPPSQTLPMWGGSGLTVLVSQKAAPPTDTKQLHGMRNICMSERQTGTLTTSYSYSQRLCSYSRDTARQAARVSSPPPPQTSTKLLRTWPAQHRKGEIHNPNQPQVGFLHFSPASVAPCAAWGSQQACSYKGSQRNR